MGLAQPPSPVQSSVHPVPLFQTSLHPPLPRHYPPARRTLGRTPPATTTQAGASPLRYPGKLATDLSGGRLFVSDSNNHRVVITDLAGNFIEAVGGGVGWGGRGVG